MAIKITVKYKKGSGGVGRKRLERLSAGRNFNRKPPYSRKKFKLIKNEY